MDQRGVIERILEAPTPDAVVDALAGAGVPHLFWQAYEPTAIRVWDRFPSGFLAHYYGSDADAHCAVAQAVRAKWPLFTFEEARAAFTRSEAALQAERVWRAFGVEDGLIITGGRADRRAIAVVGLETAGGALALVDRRLDAVSLAARRLDRLLLDSDELTEIPRRSLGLPAPLQAVLRMQIEHPGWDARAQAQALGISTQTLSARHDRIAELFGVSSFAGAVVKAIASGGDTGAP